VKKLGLLVAVALLFRGGAANARCDAPSQLSTCIDVDTLWPHAGAARFAFIGGAATAAPGAFGLGLVTTYLSRPLILQAPTSTVTGAEVIAVDRLWNTTLLWSLGLVRGFELGVALPFTAYRSGSGVSALVEQRTTELSRTAIRDPRLGATFALARGRAASGLQHAIVSRLELALPLGESSSFAGDRFAVAAPSFAAELTYDRLVFAAELGARLRATSELAGSRVGSQVMVAVGVSANFLDSDLLSLQLEAMTLPTLVAQHELMRVDGVAERVVANSRPWLAPTEWQASLRTAPLLGASASLGAGGSLPLTGDYGITSPGYRVVLALRYDPPAAQR